MLYTLIIKAICLDTTIEAIRENLPLLGEVDFSVEKHWKGWEETTVRFHSNENLTDELNIWFVRPDQLKFPIPTGSLLNWSIKEEALASA